MEWRRSLKSIMSKPFNLGDIVKIKDDVKSLNDFKYWGARVDEIFKIICMEHSYDVDCIVELDSISIKSKYTLNTITEYIEHVNPLLIYLI